MTASVPLDTSRSLSIDGMESRISSASSVSAPVGAPKVDPFAAARAIARTTFGCAWPRISGPQEPTKST
jgi:hypothetical protein